MTKLLFSDLTYYLRGICFDIHNELRGGHREADYENALAIALESDGVSFQRQPVYRVDYRDKQVGEYRPDFVLADTKVLLELKAQPSITPLHKAQVLSYLQVTDADLGMILNFGGKSMQFDRLPNFLRERTVVPGVRQQTMRADLLYPELTARIINALHRVHLELGPGYLHQVYRRATRIELSRDDFQTVYLRELPLRFRGVTINQTPTRLFLIDQKLLLATVALHELRDREHERMRWALAVTGCQLGMIANFHPLRLKLNFIRQTEINQKR